MHNRKIQLIGLLVAIGLLLAACGGGGGASFDTNFPLPSSVENFTGDGGDSQINYQTDLSLDEVVAFYRDALGAEGMTERTLNTSITDEAISLVFDGHPSGQVVVVQAVDLGANTNVNVRLEDI